MRRPMTIMEINLPFLVNSDKKSVSQNDYTLQLNHHSHSKSIHRFTLFRVNFLFHFFKALGL